MFTVKSEHYLNKSTVWIKEVSEHHAATGNTGIPLRGRGVGTAEASSTIYSRLQFL